MTTYPEVTHHIEFQPKNKTKQLEAKWKVLSLLHFMHIFSSLIHFSIHTLARDKSSTFLNIQLVVVVISVAVIIPFRCKNQVNLIWEVKVSGFQILVYQESHKVHIWNAHHIPRIHQDKFWFNKAGKEPTSWFGCR